jgi:ABC-type multidrug transport system fused ATPase/permease subunit
MYGKTMGKFRPAARDLKRSESKSRSPIYTHFREALKGVTTIRSIPGSRNRWEMKHQRLTDDNLSVFYSIKALDRWLSVRLETLGNIVVFAAAVTSIILSRAGVLKAGKAGWALTQSLSITGLLVRFLSWMVPPYLPTSFSINFLSQIFAHSYGRTYTFSLSNLYFKTNDRVGLFESSLNQSHRLCRFRDALS